MNAPTLPPIRAGNAAIRGQRAEQQDAFGFSDFNDAALRAHGGVLMVVADGMGGMHGGREASTLAVAQFLAAWAAKTPEEGVPAALERSLAAANRAVYELAIGREGEGEVGTTLVAAVVQDGALHWVSAGDSRLYLYQAATDRLLCCTRDHTHGNALQAGVARGELTAAEAAADPDAEALVSFLGLREIPDIDRSPRPWPLGPGDRVLACSDGLYNSLPADTLTRLLRQDAQAAADALIRAVEACAHPWQDNATAAVIAVGPAPAAPRPAVGVGVPPPAWRRWLLPGLAALGLLALGIGIGVYLSGLAPPVAPDEPATAAAASATASEASDAGVQGRDGAAGETVRGETTAGEPPDNDAQPTDPQSTPPDGRAPTGDADRKPDPPATDADGDSDGAKAAGPS